jgi:hypothetical protein
MKKYLLLVVGLVSLFIACKKYNSLRDDINGNLYIRGRIFRVNNITNNSDTTQIASGRVYLGYYPDSINYIYSVVTDANGYFVFNNAVMGKHYLLTVNDTSGGAKYNGKQDFTLDTSLYNLRLYSLPSQSGQNGFVYKVTDGSNAPINACMVCAFTSLQFYNQALLIDSCKGASYTLTTNAFGKASQLNVPVGTYYLFFQTQAGKITLKADTTIVVKSQGLLQDSIQVK